MSKFFVCDTVYEDRDAIVEVLREMGYSPTIHPDGIELTDYHGNTAIGHIVVPKAQIKTDRKWRPEPYGDLAFSKQQDGRYRLLIDKTDRSAIVHKDPLTGNRDRFENVFQRSYVVKAAQRKMLNRGITGFKLDKTKVTVDQKGRVQVVLVR